MSWHRHRFHANEDDYRPVAWPPPGPYWCTGYGDGYTTVVAYTPTDEPLTFWWPEATHVDTEEVGEIVFSDRFPEPDWWANVKDQGSESREEQRMSEQRYCCQIDCTRSAEFAIFGESGFPEDHTDACVDHVGALLGTPIHAPGDNRSWQVTVIDDP